MKPYLEYKGGRGASVKFCLLTNPQLRDKVTRDHSFSIDVYDKEPRTTGSWSEVSSVPHSTVVPSCNNFPFLPFQLILIDDMSLNVCMKINKAWKEITEDHWCLWFSQCARIILFLVSFLV